VLSQKARQQSIAIIVSTARRTFDVSSISDIKCLVVITFGCNIIQQDLKAMVKAFVGRLESAGDCVKLTHVLSN
jgi:hypothetical protein